MSDRAREGRHCLSARARAQRTSAYTITQLMHACMHGMAHGSFTSMGETILQLSMNNENAQL